MKTQYPTILVPWLLFFPVGAYADQPSFQLTLNQSELCRSITATFTFKSVHEKGSRHGLLNEENYGIGGDCYLGKGLGLGGGFTLHTPVSIRALTNSQNGPTFVAGPGIRIRSPQIWRLSLEGGRELPFVYYGIPKYHGYVYGFLPITYKSVGFELPQFAGWRLGHLSVAERRFGREEKVRLYSLEWRKMF